MALVIRLRKMGRINHQVFRLVVLDKRRPRDGQYIEMLGWYNPKQDGNNAAVKSDRILHWLEKGAQLSESARALVKKHAPEILKRPEKKKTKVKKQEVKKSKPEKAAKTAKVKK